MSTTTPAGTVSAPLLASYGAGVEQAKEWRTQLISEVYAIEIGFMREAVASGLSVRDLQATLKAGQVEAKSHDLAVLPDLGVGKVQTWTTALALYDTVDGAPSLDLPDLLNVAWNASRLPQGFNFADKTIEEVIASIPARKESGKAGEGEKAKAPRKTSTRAIASLTELAKVVQDIVEKLPADLSTLSDFDIVAIVSIAKTFSSLQRSIKKVA